MRPAGLGGDVKICAGEIMGIRYHRLWLTVSVFGKIFWMPIF
jgi:hypothetical protein